jgi:hypothetical protein
MGDEIKWKLTLFRMWRTHVTDRICMAIAWRLPHKLAMWAFIRVAAHASTGKYANTVVPELTAMDALQRWETRKEAS